MKITLKMLRNEDISKKQKRRFRKAFPNGFKVTRANCMRAWKSKLEMDEFAYHFLKDYQFKAFETEKWNAYKIWEDHDCSDRAEKKYEKALALAFFKCSTMRPPNSKKKVWCDDCSMLPRIRCGCMSVQIPNVKKCEAGEYIISNKKHRCKEYMEEPFIPDDRPDY